jgi:hypothetical protein
MKYGDPRLRPTMWARWFFTIVTAVLGAIILVQSYSRSGIALDWRVSAGVAALAFAALSLLERLHYPSGTQGITRRQLIIVPIVALGLTAVWLAARQRSEWAQSVLLEAGIAAVFIAAVDLLLATIVSYTSAYERAERSKFEELALLMGFRWEMPLLNYYWMREMLKEKDSKFGPSDLDQTARLLRYAKRAASLPESLT